MWICPKCNREFEKPNQWHSCGDYSLDKLLLNKPESTVVLFHYLADTLKDLGEVDFEPVQTSIRVSTNKQLFAMIRILKNSINMEIVLRRDLEDFLVLRSVKFNKTDYAHFLKFYDKEDVTEQVVSWFIEAYNTARNI